MASQRKTSMSSRMTSKGQVTVPKAVRDALAIRPGAQVAFALGEQGAVLSRGGDDDVRTGLEALRGFPGWTWEGSTEAFMEMTRGESDA